jgi:hypothetical protein
LCAIVERSERNPGDSVGKAIGQSARRFDGESRLPRPTGSDECHQTRIVPLQQPDDVLHLAFASEKAGRWDGQIAEEEGVERRELRVAELVDPDW